MLKRCKLKVTLFYVFIQCLLLKSKIKLTIINLKAEYLTKFLLADQDAGDRSWPLSSPFNYFLEIERTVV